MAMSASTAVDELPAAVTLPWLQDTFLPAIRAGGAVTLRFLLAATGAAQRACAPRPNVAVVAGHATVLGPTRGHAADLAAVVLRILAAEDDPVFVFLGDYIDGGQQSSETLAVVFAMVACLGDAVTLLRGRHEFLFAVPADWTAGTGRLDEELRRSCIVHANAAATAAERADAAGMVAAEAAVMNTAEAAVRGAFDALQLAAVVGGKYFCVSGGICSELPTLAAIDAIDRACPAPHDKRAVCDLVTGDPMDEDDEQFARQGCFLYARNAERGVGCIYSFEAACAFLERNALHMVLRGNGFTCARQQPSASGGVGINGRPWATKHSPFDPGYRLFRKHPSTGAPAVVTLFSAPSFCSLIRNHGAFAEVGRDGLVRVQQFAAHSERPVQMPNAAVGNAFTWSMDFMVERLRHAVQVMVTDVDGDDTVERIEDAALRDKTMRFRRLCRHCRATGTMDELRAAVRDEQPDAADAADGTDAAQAMSL
jgi:serine/threonine-protein phosphatase 2B catalytic subunit